MPEKELCYAKDVEKNHHLKSMCVCKNVFLSGSFLRVFEEA